MDDLEGLFGAGDATQVSPPTEDVFAGTNDVPSFGGDDGMEFASSGVETTVLPADDDNDNFFGVSQPTEPVTMSDDFFSGGQEMDADLSYPEPSQSAPTMDLPREKTPLELWSAQQYERLQEEAAQEELKKQKMMAAAEKEREEFYAQRAKQIEAKMQTNREKEDITYENGSSGELWEKVYNLIDPSPKVAEGRTDLSRMRQILVKLKHTPIIA